MGKMVHHNGYVGAWERAHKMWVQTLGSHAPKKTEGVEPRKTPLSELPHPDPQSYSVIASTLDVILKRLTGAASEEGITVGHPLVGAVNAELTLLSGAIDAFKAEGDPTKSGDRLDKIDDVIIPRGLAASLVYVASGRVPNEGPLNAYFGDHMRELAGLPKR